MIRIYGDAVSRTHRVLWMLEELGLEYEQVNDTGELGKPSAELLALNPNGKIPTLVDGDRVLWESLAINLYLAERYDRGLGARTEDERILARQWSFWVATEVEETLLVVVRNRVMFAAEERDASAADAAEEALAPRLAVLDGVLRKSEFLLGDRFSIADINVASILAMTALAGVSLDAWPEVNRWLRACVTRPAARKVFAQAREQSGI